MTDIENTSLCDSIFKQLDTKYHNNTLHWVVAIANFKGEACGPRDLLDYLIWRDDELVRPAASIFSGFYPLSQKLKCFLAEQTNETVAAIFTQSFSSKAKLMVVSLPHECLPYKVYESLPQDYKYEQYPGDLILQLGVEIKRRQEIKNTPSPKQSPSVPPPESGSYAKNPEENSEEPPPPSGIALR